MHGLALGKCTTNTNHRDGNQCGVFLITVLFYTARHSIVFVGTHPLTHTKKTTIFYVQPLLFFNSLFLRSVLSWGVAPAV